VTFPRLRPDTPAQGGTDSGTGLHAAFYASVGFMVIAAALSALRGSPAREPKK